jgi:hypothetical protein
MKTKSVVEPRPIQRMVLNLEYVAVVAGSVEFLTILLVAGTMG